MCKHQTRHIHYSRGRSEQIWLWTFQVRVTWGAALMATWVTAMVYAMIADWVRRTNRRSTVAVRRVANTICES